MDFAALEELIKAKLTDAQVRITDLTGSGDHLGITVLSDQFAGKRMLAQHRMVMDILKPKFGGELHAVQLTTGTRRQERT